jgi:YVTN family beta-propeller protein
MRGNRFSLTLVVLILPLLLLVASPAGALAQSVDRPAEVSDLAAGPAVTATVSVGSQPGSIAVNPRTNRVYVANVGSHTVSVIDGTRNAVVATIDFSDVPSSDLQAIAVNALTNRLYVGDASSGAVYVVDGTTNARLASIPGVGNVWQLAVNPTTNKIYAAITDFVVIVDGGTNAVVARNRVGNAVAGSVPSSVAVNPTTNQVYALSGNEGFISVIDGQTNLQDSGILIPRVFASLAVDPTTTRVYGAQGDRLVVVDGQTNATTGVIGLPGSAFNSIPAFNPTLGRIYVPVQAGNSTALAVVDTKSGLSIANDPLGGQSSNVAINLTTNLVYVTTPSNNTVTVVSDSPGGPTAGMVRDDRYFSQTSFRADDDTIWDYFNRRGGIATFGYPVSRTFLFQGFLIQMFQRRIVQLDSNGNARLLNLLDPGLLPYTSFNGAEFPGVDSSLITTAPPAPDASATVAFVVAHAPDTFQAMPVNFDQTFTKTVTAAVAFPNGSGNAALLPGFNLEMWGIPTSRPALDPHNHNFVYLRFQRGIMMYDASCECTQGILLADYLKSILTGQNLPPDLADEAQDSIFYGQYDPTQRSSVHNSSLLPSTDLTNAFTGE